MYDVFLIQLCKKINKEVKDIEGYDNEVLDEEWVVGIQNGVRELMGFSNGYSNGVVDEYVNVRM